ncbi:flagellar basal body rod C-terminal domain-containing protein [Pseudogracilibacillus sp. SO30301A]|uniref:flagellar basal body rod C-terminal domain-containing protein n=1 Tax=Pseudogracilibacillus sp. SO30301A TaxID=3098291 RepID=UPI003FA7AD3F
MNINDLVHPVDMNTGLLPSPTLEMSNVNIGEQMTQLINAQPSYQFNSRTITMANQMQGLINQLR